MWHRSFFFLLLLTLGTLHNLTLVILRSWSPDQFGEMCAEYDMRQKKINDNKQTSQHNAKRAPEEVYSRQSECTYYDVN